MGNKKVAILIVIALIITILGGTLAYWGWSSTNAEKTNLTFTVGSNFSCSATGGGNITNTNYFVPTSCTNSTYAIQREITTSITNTGNNPVYLDMWLTINSIGSGLTGTNNFKYALTTSSNSCTTGVLEEGNFSGKQANDTITLLEDAEAGSTYYLYVWLDSAETSSSTQNQSVSLSLGGECSNYGSYVYTVNLIGVDSDISYGAPIPNGITVYSTPADAMDALATEIDMSGENLPFFLRHKTSDISGWCVIMNGDTSGCLYKAENESDCNTALSMMPLDGNTYTCSNVNIKDAVVESHVGFVVTPELVAESSGMTAGTYYLKGGPDYNTYNIGVLQTAFGSGHCTTSSSNTTCSSNSATSFTAESNIYGDVGARIPGVGCFVSNVPYCYAP